jgi:hypothetical protein
MTAPLAPRPHPGAPLDLATFARVAGLHPDLVRRLFVLGLLDAHADPDGGLWFAPDQLPTLARIRRLRTGLGLNWAALGLVVDLLDRLAALEAAARRPHTTFNRHYGG